MYNIQQPASLLNMLFVGMYVVQGMYLEKKIHSGLTDARLLGFLATFDFVIVLFHLFL